jgi:phenylacetate-CoA ligase
VHESLERLYFAAPVPLQHLLISLYGGSLRLQRYGAAHSRAVAALARSEFLPRDQLEDLQLRSLKALVRHAFETVPFYREMSRKLGIAHQDIASIQDLKKLPTVTKDDIRADPERFLSSAFRPRALKRVNTSGTTGTPMPFWLDAEALQNNYAFYARALSWAGVGVSDRSVTFAGRVFIPPAQDAPPYWRHNVFNNNLLMSSYRISEATASSYLEKLERFAPVFVDSYPSAIFALAQFCEAHALPCGARPRAIITSSETLLEHQRRTIEHVFGCRVYDQYGSAEMVVFASECERGTLHLHPEYGITEVLSLGQEAPIGEPGELVCTGFQNWAMPLIRYEIGDTAVRSDAACPCGRHFPPLSAIVGRIDDTIVSPDGRHVGRLDPIFKGVSGITETQIVQERIDRIIVRMVRGQGFESDAARVVMQELRKRVGEGVDLELSYVDRIERGSSGKFRSVVSRLAKDAGSSAPGASREARS